MPIDNKRNGAVFQRLARVLTTIAVPESKADRSAVGTVKATISASAMTTSAQSGFLIRHSRPFSEATERNDISILLAL